MENDNITAVTKLNICEISLGALYCAIAIVLTRYVSQLITIMKYVDEIPEWSIIIWYFKSSVGLTGLTIIAMILWYTKKDLIRQVKRIEEDGK